MKRKILTVLAGLAISAGMTWAGTLDQNAADFSTTVNWCQFGCTGAPFATPTNWVSSGADTGEVGLNGTGQNWYNLQQGTTFFGNFSPNMGLVYNGSAYGNTPTDIVMTFDQAERGAGAYIMSDYYGAFTATITLYDSSFLSLGSFTVGGTANGNNDGSAIFLGAFDGTADVWAVQFDAVGIGPNEPDFAIGMAGMYNPQTTGVPEPASMLLMGPALLGLAAFGRKRILNSRRGNN